MKNLAFILPALLVIALISCEKDNLSANEVTNNLIQGEWDVTSYTIDGVEEIVPGFSVDMRYTKTGEATGSTEWRFFTGALLVELVKLDYEIINDGQQIDFGSGGVLNVEATSDFLQLEGNLDGYRHELEAEKE